MTDIFTQHFFERINQRGIDWLAVQAALLFGESVFAKDSHYYFLGKRAIKRLMKIFIPQNPEKWEGLVVVFDTKKNRFVTCFKNKNWLKKIRHKN